MWSVKTVMLFVVGDHLVCEPGLEQDGGVRNVGDLSKLWTPHQTETPYVVSLLS